MVGEGSVSPKTPAPSQPNRDIGIREVRAGADNNSIPGKSLGSSRRMREIALAASAKIAT